MFWNKVHRKSNIIYMYVWTLERSWKSPREEITDSKKQLKTRRRIGQPLPAYPVSITASLTRRDEKTLTFCHHDHHRTRKLKGSVCVMRPGKIDGDGSSKCDWYWSIVTRYFDFEYYAGELVLIRVYDKIFSTEKLIKTSGRIISGWRENNCRRKESALSWQG